ncbi:MAG: hypothetical protein IMW89_03675 [Ktedonobacteraceae bacterium]|nr:hypothetical protein [Ktedonobacteraceae bacterium]
MSSTAGNLSTSPPSSTVTQSSTHLDAHRRESRLRLGVGASMLLGVFLLLFGAAWDAQWHAEVGRDRFFTPPHVTMYLGATAVGLLCLVMVIVETIRYHRHDPAVNDETTIKVLGLFHAPLGFVVTGFGMLMILLSAPLDNYWHLLYGIDVTVWSPFHIMGLLSGSIAFLGVIFLLSSEATRARQYNPQQARNSGTMRRWRLPSLPDVFQVAGLASTLAIILVVTLDNARLFQIGGLTFAIYPLVASLCAFFLVASTRITGRIGSATLMALIFTLFRLLLAITLKPAVAMLVAQQQLYYRADVPDFVIFTQAYPAWLIAGGLLVDATYLLLPRLLKGRAWIMTATAMTAGLLAAASVALLETSAWREQLDSATFTGAWLTSLPVAALIGAGWGWLGDRFAISARLLDR